MGFYQYDDPSLYRQNVLEIPWDKLQDVPRNEDGTPTAINQGTVQVRCFIHPYCPFLKVPKEEYDLAFNNITVPVIEDSLPDLVKGAFTTTRGVEGMHFTERYAYRHTYLEKEEEQFGEKVFIPIAIINEPSINNTRYQEEQTWIIKDSVFDWKVRDDVNLAGSLTYFEQRCNDVASWAYTYPKVNSAYTLDDELQDYKLEFYEANSSTAATGDENPGINVNNVQFAKQTAAQDCFGSGVHWRVEKKTSLFRGEDFFIDFKRFSKSVTSGSEGKSEPIRFDAALSRYAPIDIIGDIYSPKNVLVLPDDFPEVPIYPNQAIRQSEDVSERTSWRLDDQAYYIIELGGETTGNNQQTDHYFIIITERAYPIFVMIDDVDGIKYSRTLSAYSDKVGGVAGKALIDAERFRITVRNHLGKLVIYFDINGERRTPWVISKDDYNIFNDISRNANSNGRSINTKEPVTVPIVVPQDKISIWGGNLSSGFSFGPLQYSTSSIDFRWPQQHALPMDSAISARLTTSDEYIHDMARYQDVPGSPSNAVPLFTQGAHFYKQWGTSNQVKGLRRWKEGTFFFGNTYDPLIELSQAVKADGEVIPGVRDVTIELKNWNRVVNDVDRRRVKFYLNFLLESGSHVFAGNGGGIISGWRDKVDYRSPEPDNVSDDLWVLEACKTPILTGVRLVGEQNDLPRWEDGTGIAGYDGLPNTDAPYFRDVSHHALSYTENWTANDFFELEHSGTIQFLLKDINVAVDNTGTMYSFNDVQYLKDLQNKNFYIEVWAGYTPLKDGLEYTKLGGFYKLMTGMCQGGVIDKTAAREIMTCQIKDYKEVLKDKKFFNSPFFDGMRDINAVSEILTMAGFRSLGAYDPGRLIRTMKDDDFSGPLYYQTPDGRFFISNPYALPSSYRRIEQAYFKFDAGTSLYDGIMKIAQTSSKLFYFDQHGVAHFESYMDLIMQNLLGDNILFDLFAFTSIPYGPHNPHQGQLIYNKLEWQHRQEDVHSHLKIISSTPNQELLIADDVRWEAVDQPTVEGFVGYKKLFYQKEGMLGSEGAVRNLIDFYRVMFRPELYVKFETHGLPIRATDFITVDGQFLRVSKVSHEINAEKNRWWMNVEGERMQPIQ